MNDTGVRELVPTRDFRVDWVFGGITPVLRQRLIAFWLREGALDDPGEAWRLACILWLWDRTCDDVAGVCTVAIGWTSKGAVWFTSAR